jgi:hypothetical protein
MSHNYWRYFDEQLKKAGLRNPDVQRYPVDTDRADMDCDGDLWVVCVKGRHALVDTDEPPQKAASRLFGGDER